MLPMIYMALIDDENDKKAFENSNGLMAAIDCLKGNRLFSYVHLRESVRSETAKLADLLDQED